MSERRQASLSKLVKAREQLRKAQSRVAALEMELSEDQLKPAVSLSLEERYHYTLDNMLEGCQIIGFDWRYLYLNNIAAEQGRQEKTELLGFTMMERYPGIEKSELFNVLQNCMQERTIEQLENRFDYPDGTTGWFELRIQPVPEGIVIFSLDITERKRAEAILHEDEARLRVFVEHAPAAIAMLDTDMKYLLVSHRWISDYRLSDSDVIGRSHYDLFPDIPEHWRTIHQRCLKGAVESSDADPFPRADGRLDWVRWEIRPWRKNDGTIGGIFIFSEVITERKEAEEILQRYAQRMEILHLIDKGIINANSFREVVETALKYIRRLIPCQRANVGLIDMTKGEGVIFAVDYDADTALGQGFRVPIRQDFFDGYDARHVKVVPDLRVLQETNPRFKQAVNEGLLSGLNVILLDHDVPIGTLGLFANTLNFFTDEHQQIIVEVGNQLAIAIRQMRLSDALAAQLETLDQTREFLQTTLDAFPANTTVLDPDGNIVAVNLSWKQFADLNSGDVDQYYLGKNYLEVCDKTIGLNADEAAAAAAGIRAVISGDLPTFQLEYPCHSLTQKRWFVLRVTSFGEQAPRRVVVAHIDITERKQAEAIEHEQRLLAETLRDSLALLTTSLDVETVMQQILAYSGMVISSDAGTIILFEGDRGRVAYSRGYSAEAEAFFNANLIDIDSGVYGRSKDDSTFYLAADTQSTPDWTDFPFTNWVRSSIGVQIVAQDKVIGLLIADSATPNQFQHKDVENLQAFARYAALALENAYHVDQLEDKVEKRTADLQAAKERVEAILNNSPDGILLVDTGLNIQQANVSFNRIFRCQPDDYYGKSLVDLIHPEDTNSVKDTLQTVVVERQGKHIEIRASRKDGTIFDAELSIGLVRGDGFVCVIRDISERKRLNRQFQYHASLQASVSDAVIATDMDFRIQSWNRAAEMVYGWSAAETIGKFANEILRTTYESEADRARILQDFLERGAWQGEVIQHHRDGTPINILASANLFKDETGQPFGVVSVNRNITERKRAAEALQKSAAEIHDLYNNAPCGYHSLDKEGSFVQINDTELRWLGYTRDEVIGKLDLAQLFTPESLITFRKNFPLFKERGRVNDLEFDLVRKDGSIMHILLNATAIYDEHGQFLQSRSTIFDITELKQAQQTIIESEERYRLLAENIADVIMTFSLDRLITYMSPSCERLLGYLPEEVEGKSHSEFIHSEDYPQVIDRTRQAVASKENFYTNQFRLRHKAGHYIWYEVRTRIVFDHDTGNVVQFISVLRDITERKQAEAQLQKSEERLRTIIENIPVMLSFFDVEGRFEFVNQCWLDQVGWTLEDLTTAEEPLTLFYPDPEYRQHVLEYMLSAEPGWRDFNSQTKHRGERITSWANVRLSDGRGIGIGQDVTERRRAEAALRESEERFRRAIINAPFPIMIHADDGEVLHISNAWAEISGYTHADIPTMTIWLEKAHGENSHIIRAGIEKVYTLTKPQRGGEFLIRTKSGEQRIWDFISAPLALMPDGRRMVSSMAVDITERKHAEDVLKEKMEEDHQFQSYLKALHEIIIELTGIDELEAFYKRAVELGRERLGFERLAMFLYDEQSGSAVGTFGTDTQGNLVDERGIRFKPDPNGVMQRSFERAERFYFNEQVTLFNEEVSVGTGWNVAAVLWNGAQSLGWFVADNLLSHAPASKSLLDIIGLYALSIGTLLAQKQTRIALKESEALYRLLAENINDLIMRSTFTGECLYISPSVQTILGYAPEELIGQPIFDLIYPDDQATIWEAYASALERNDLIMPHQYRAKHKDGRYIWLEMVGKPLLMDGTKEVYGVITSSRNITERKQAEDALRESEEKLRLFIESAPMATLISDKLGRIILLNHETEKLFGYARNELLGKSIDELIPDEMRKAHIDLRSQYISGTIERRTHGVEAPAVHKNGTVFPAEVQLSHIDLSDGPIVISSVIDITARKQAEETLRQALAKEKELGELKSRFVSMASHEFRTPLASILAVTETLMAYRYQLSDDQIDEKFSKIKAQIQHLKDIMEDVLLLARMQSRRVEFRPVPVDIDSLCRSVLDEFQSRTDVHHQLDYRCGDGIREIKLDRKLMRQVISNLVSNAIKYSPIDKPIQISLECSDEVFILKVQDEGIGIPEADLQHLFEAFHRASNVGAISGTGLGLVITKEAVELHGGSITVDSYAGMGTTFTVRIPTSRKGDNENDENSSY